MGFWASTSTSNYISQAPAEGWSGELFRYAVEAMHDALCVLDEAGNVIFCNASAEQLFGTKEDCLGQPMFGPPWKLLNRDGSPLSKNALPDVHTLKITETYEKMIGVSKTKSDLRWLAVTMVPIRRPGEDHPTMALVTLHDVTDEKHARDVLIQRETYFRALIENSYDIITVLDTDGTICFESPSVHRVLGYRPQDLLGKKAFDYVHPEDRERVLAAFRNRVAHPTQRQSTIYRAQHMDGSWITFETVSTIQSSEAGRARIVLNSREVNHP